jgi:hypothetical protein
VAGPMSTLIPFSRIFIVVANRLGPRLSYELFG